MARPLKFTDTMLARFAGGTFDRIARLLAPDEDRASFIRNSVDREMERREAAHTDLSPPDPEET